MSVDVRQLLQLADATRLAAWIGQSVDRPVLEAEVKRIARSVDVASRSREELAHALVSFAGSDRDVRRALGKAIVAATALERQKLSSFDDATWRAALAPYLTQRRASSKFVLAMLVLATTEGEPWSARVKDVLQELAAAEQDGAATLTKADAAGIGADVRALASAFADAERSKGTLEEKVVTLEKERAQILARLGQHEADLKRMHETSKELERELEAARKAKAAPAPEPMDDEVTELKRKLRRVEKQAAFVRERERDRDHLKLVEAERDAFAREAAMLRTQLQLALVAAQSVPLSGAAATTAAPLASAPVTDPRPARKKRTGVYVDGANLAGAARHLYKRNVDFAALQRLLVPAGVSSTCVAYVIDNGAAGFDAFHKALKHAGFQVRRRTPKVLPDGSQKADQDVEITVDIMAARADYDRVVLVSGDSDFLPLVRALKKEGVRVEAAMFRQRVAQELVGEVDAFIPLGETILV